MSKDAPWQPLAELDPIEAAPATCTTWVPGATGMLSPVSLGTVTPSFDVVHPLPPTGVAEPFCDMDVILTVRVFGFCTWTIRSADPPGTRVDVGEPVATAWTVTVLAVPSVADP